MPQALKEEDLKIITKKVYALYAKHGFDGISMDQVSIQAKVSKATLYRYFTSKEDIVKGMVRYLISNLNSVQFTAIEGIENVMDGIQAFYEKSALIAALSGSQFLTDLKRKFPDDYEACISSMRAMQDRFAEFFRQSVEKKCFRDLLLPLVGRQFSSMLSSMLDTDYLESCQVSLQEAIRENYRMFLLLILKDEYLFVTNCEETYDFARDLADILQGDFFVDGIQH